MNISKRVLSITFLTSFIFLITCSQKEKTPTLDENGIEIISNPEYGEWQDQEDPVKFEIIDSYNLEETTDLLISNLWGMKTDADGNIYFYDSESSRLVSLNPDGSLRWVTGEQGKGPGDFEQARPPLVLNDLILISNIQGSILDIFSTGGKFIKTLNYPSSLNFVSLDGISDSGKLVVSSPYWGNLGMTVSILTLADTLSTDTTFSIIQSKESEIMEGFSGSAGIVVQGDQIVSGNLTDYSIGIYDLNGSLLKRITRDFDKLVRPGFYKSGGSSMMRMFGSLRPSVVLKNGSFFSSVSWPLNVDDPDQFVKRSVNGGNKDVESKQSLDLFDKYGKLLYSLQDDAFFEEYGSISHVDSNGFVYFVKYDPSPTIIKTKINMPEYESSL